MTPRYAVQKTLYLYRNPGKGKGNNVLMKMYGEMKVNIDAFIISALDVGNLSASRTDCPIAFEGSPITY
jgi:hypothetical protein